MNLYRRLEIATAYGIKDWIKPCIVALVERGNPPTYSESCQLGPELYYIVSILRTKVKVADERRSHTTWEKAYDYSAAYDSIVKENGWDWMKEQN